MARVKLRCIMRCPGLKSTYRKKDFLDFFFSFTSSRQDFGRTRKLFLRMFYWLLLLRRVNRYSLDTPANSFVSIPCIVISGMFGQGPQQMRGAKHAFQSCLPTT